MRYQLIVAFDDCTSKSELTDNLQQALGAIEIYLEMPDVFVIHLIDNKAKRIIFDWCHD